MCIGCVKEIVIVVVGTKYILGFHQKCIFRMFPRSCIDHCRSSAVTYIIYIMYSVYIIYFITLDIITNCKNKIIIIIFV